MEILIYPRPFQSQQVATASLGMAIPCASIRLVDFN